MEFLHKELDLSAGDIVEVTLSHAANVQLLDASNYQDYRNRRQYRYFGGHITASPFQISAPYPGRWHLVVDLGGSPGTVSASVRVLSSASA